MKNIIVIVFLFFVCISCNDNAASKIDISKQDKRTSVSLDQVDKSNLEPNCWLGHSDLQTKLLDEIQASELYRT